MMKIEDLFTTVATVVVEEEPWLDDDVDRYERIEPAVKAFLAEWNEEKDLSDVDVAAWLLIYQAQWFLKRGEWCKPAADNEAAALTSKETK